MAKKQIVANLPRLPLKGTIDLTYRCNNDCRHCWVRLAPGAAEKQNELTYDEIIDIINQARALGCREWSISGGEPMLRPDFYDILDYISARSQTYSLNTNGTLITPRIAQLLKERKGNKMVALYGASKEVYEDVSRIPGSFDAAMRGFRLLKQAGAGFVVQVIPMQANYHEYETMIELAKSLSPHWRIGAPWLYLSADGDAGKNHEICQQRLPADVVVQLDPPVVTDNNADETGCGCVLNENLFESCINVRRDFYIDPYGRMTFCSYIRDPELMYDLRRGTVQDAWDHFIPSLKTKVKASQEFRENCGSCAKRASCNWCMVYGYLEHGRYTAPVPYLCSVADAAEEFKKKWRDVHTRYYQLAGLTIKLESDVPLNGSTFHHKLDAFEVKTPGDDVITIRHHFTIPPFDEKKLGQQIYRKAPWAIYKNGSHYTYLGISPDETDDTYHKAIVFTHDYSYGRFYSRDDSTFKQGKRQSLTLTASDQLMLAPALAKRQACFFHASGIVYKGLGFIFIGHSEAGKSTMVKLMQEQAEILNDERIIVRRWPDGFKIHGTWSHGEIPIVSPNSAPLGGLFFLNKATENSARPVDKAEAVKRMIACLIKSHETKEWWEAELDLLERIADEVPTAVLNFDKSGQVRTVLDMYV
ncbi:radical SAM protein [candidate division KSB1 bacterium]|nr:radical SAM protein [candidate division KSB1 bacterium]